MTIFARSLVFSFCIMSVGCGTAKFSGNNSRKPVPAAMKGSAGQESKACLPLVEVPVVTVPVAIQPGVTVPVVTVPVVVAPADEDPNQNGDKVPAVASA